MEPSNANTRIYVGHVGIYINKDVKLVVDIVCCVCRSVPLEETLTLTQPRLVAGISVSGAKIVRKQPQMARGRIMNRKK